jgi:hypothetical protein
MKTTLYLLVFALIFLWGCETRTFTYVSSVKRTLEYTVDQEGAFSARHVMNDRDFNKDLDLPVDAIVRAVNIEYFAIDAQPRKNNQASNVQLSCYAGADEKLFADNVVLPVDLTFEYKAMPNLIPTGVQSIRDDLEGFIVSSDPSTIAFRIAGDSHPATGERINVNIKIEVSIAVAYDVESEFPKVL